MGSYDKLYQKIIEGQSDANINFQDLCSFLQKLEFDMRISGSHHII